LFVSRHDLEFCCKISKMFAIRAKKADIAAGYCFIL
jgi:hypothetical protein